MAGIALAEKLKLRGSEPGKVPKGVKDSKAGDIAQSVPRYKTIIE
jgi:hypothetical protein